MTAIMTGLIPMPLIRLPDGTEKKFDQPVTVLEVAQSIGAGLAKAALAGKVNDKLVDVHYRIEEDANLRIITDKDTEGLEIIRHSTAHLLAHAVKSLFPGAQVTIGPVIEDGFYYDFSFERPFTPEDLEKIEAKMQELAKADFPVTRKVLSHDEAIELFSRMGEKYKVEIIEGIPRDEMLTAYQQHDFIDLCRGPHVPRTSLLKAFKLTKLAGAYWRGDSRNEMLQRIYGTAWADQKALKNYLNQIEEAKKRDHREIGKKMDLFHFQAEAPGMVFWHPNGWKIVRVLREHLREIQMQNGYQEINTPQVVDISLWQLSGHAENFRDDMFVLNAEDREFAIKPMSCPCHVQVFKQGIKSYRDLPIRLAEFGHVHRNEASGTLHGLMRVRALVQDDGHIFCTENDIQHEVLAFVKQLHQFYSDCGFTDITHKLATRPDKRVGSDEIWSRAEHALAEALNTAGVAWDFKPGEGAFYGPKIEFTMKDCLGRHWQCGTMQVDFNMPERLGAYYITEDGDKRPPVMLHRAIMGSFERFIAVLLEHYAGRLPTWLAPVQAVIMNITDAQAAYAKEVAQILAKKGFRVDSDLRNEKIGFKIREHTIARVPYQVVVGDREVSERTLSIRSFASEQSKTVTIEEFVNLLNKEVEQRGGIPH